MKLRLRLIVWIACAVVVTFARAAESSSPTVVMIRPGTTDALSTEVMTRLSGELTTDRFYILTVDHIEGADLSRELDAAARLFNPIALFAVVRDPSGGADVWIVDRLAGLTNVRHIDVPEPNRRSQSLLAVQAVEVLRASLLANMLKRPTVGAEGTGKVAPRIAPERDSATSLSQDSRRSSFEIGAAMLASLQRMPPSLLPLLRVGYALSEYFDLRASVAALGTNPRVQGPLGRAAVDQKFALIELIGSPFSRPWIRAEVSFGVGAYRFGVEGAANALFKSAANNRLWALAIEGGCGGSLRLSRDTSLALGLYAVVTWPYPMVRIGDYDAGRTGRPMILATMTLRVFP